MRLVKKLNSVRLNPKELVLFLHFIACDKSADVPIFRKPRQPLRDDLQYLVLSF